MNIQKTLLGMCAVLALVGTGCRRGRGGGGRRHVTGPVVATLADVTPQGDDQRSLYSLGAMMGTRIGEFNLTPQELTVVMRGLNDQVTGARLLVSMEEGMPRLRAMSEARTQARAAVARREGEAYLARAASETGATRLPSGLVYKDVQVGTGAQPTPTDQVTVHYRGTLTNGEEFDSSIARNEPATFPLNGVIPCWTEGVQRMHVGGRARLVCPAEIAYGDRSQPKIPAGSTLVFEVQLISIGPASTAPPSFPNAPGATSPH
jgi:FKBP-type peptidyl-prolyl cis-trans isomerase FkpA